jgi:hypothetical protein
VRGEFSGVRTYLVRELLRRRQRRSGDAIGTTIGIVASVDPTIEAVFGETADGGGCSRNGTREQSGRHSTPDENRSAGSHYLRHPTTDDDADRTARRRIDAEFPVAEKVNGAGHGIDPEFLVLQQACRDLDASRGETQHRVVTEVLVGARQGLERHLGVSVDPNQGTARQLDFDPLIGAGQDPISSENGRVGNGCLGQIGFQGTGGAEDGRATLVVADSSRLAVHVAVPVRVDFLSQRERRTDGSAHYRDRGDEPRFTKKSPSHRPPPEFDPFENDPLESRRYAKRRRRKCSNSGRPA